MTERDGDSSIGTPVGSDSVMRAALLAARSSEVLGLQTGNVRFERNVVVIARQTYPARADSSRSSPRAARSAASRSSTRYGRTGSAFLARSAKASSRSRNRSPRCL